jgi:hypothetical protein
MSSMEPPPRPGRPAKVFASRFRRTTEYSCVVEGCPRTESAPRGHAPRCTTHGRRMVEVGPHQRES